MAEAFVKSGIADNKVFVISKTYCPFCDKAKKALKEAGERIGGGMFGHNQNRQSRTRILWLPDHLKL